MTSLSQAINQLRYSGSQVTHRLMIEAAIADLILTVLDAENIPAAVDQIDRLSASITTKIPEDLPF